MIWNAITTPSAKRDLVIGLAQAPFVVAGIGEVAAARAVVPLVEDSKLANLVGDLYKGARGRNVIGTGSTSDAIRFERATGQAVGGRFHSQKGAEYVRALEKWLGKNPDASARDQLVARSILDDLRSALGGR